MNTRAKRYCLLTTSYVVGKRCHAAGAAEGGESQHEAAAMHTHDDGRRGDG